MKDPIILLGPGRCGSTLIQRILNTSPEIVLWGEHAGFLKDLANSYFVLLEDVALEKNFYSRVKPLDSSIILGELGNPSIDISWINSFNRNRVRQTYKNLIINLLNSKIDASQYHWGFKEIRYTQDDRAIKMFLDIFPSSRLIFSIRNPFDVIQSMILSWNSLEKIESKFQTIQSKQALQLITVYAKRWNSVVSSFQYWSTQEKINCHIEKHEDLIQNPQITIDKLFDYLKLETPESALKPINFKAGKAVKKNFAYQPIVNESIYFYRDEIWKIVGSTAEYFGYTNLTLPSQPSKQLIASASIKKKAQQHCNQGDILQKASQLNEACEAYEKAIEVDPDCIKAYFKLGQILSQQNKWEEAITCFMTLLKICPYYHLAYNSLALALQKQGNYSSQEIELCQKKQVPISLVHRFLGFSHEDVISFSEKSTDLHYIEVDPGCEVLLEPKTAQNIPLDHLKSQVKIPKAFTICINSGKAWGDGFNSAILTSKNQLIKEASTRNSELSFCTAQRHDPIVIDGKVVFFPHQHTFGKINFYHWLFNDIARIGLLEASGIQSSEIDKFAFHKIETSFQKDMLQLLKIPESKFIETRYHPYIQAKQLIVPSPTPAHAPSSWACQYLRRQFLNIETANTWPEVMEKIYISRGKATTRKIINEAELIGFLEKYGFQEVLLENFKFVDQVALLSQAKFVVAPHGAGLSNLVFCNPGTKVIEILPSSLNNKIYSLICKHCNLDYHCLMGTEVENQHNVRNHQKNIHIDLKLFSSCDLFE